MSVYTDNFKTIFGTKKNIQTLRNKVLELAFQGKLTSPEKEDGLIKILLDKIELEKKALKDKGIYKQIKDKKVDFNFDYLTFPSYWESIRLGDVAYLYKSKEVNGEYLPYLDVKYLRGNKEPDLKCFGQLIKNEEYAILVDGENSGEVFKISEPGYLGSTLMLLQLSNEIDKHYILYFIKMNQLNFKGSKTGIAIPHLDKNLFKQMKFPLPSKEEQHRIVTKIETLMFEIDKLEEALNKKEYLMEMLPKAVVDTIGKCQTGEELKEQLQFAIENFDTIYQTPESMQELRNVILQLAIQGKLLPQDSSDEPASELVKKIKAEKGRLVKEGKLKKEKPSQKIEDDEIPFEIPENWVFERMNNVIDVRDGTHETPKYVNHGGYPLITGKDFYNGYISYKKTQYISESDYNKIIQRSKVDKYDILFSMIGGNIGSMVMVDDDIEIAIKNVALFKYYNPAYILPKYLFIFLKASINRIKDNADGGAQKFVSLTKLRNLVFPLPPLAEQHRIVKKLESLMEIIDQMEDKLKRKTDLLDRMA